jgi:hypothetical protein
LFLARNPEHFADDIRKQVIGAAVVLGDAETLETETLVLEARHPG